MSDLHKLVEAALGAKVLTTSAVAGGDINSAWRFALQSDARGRFDVFVKANASAPSGMFEAEASGLAFLAEAAALRTPHVLAVGESFLALEWIEGGPRARDFDDRLGRGLAALHRSSPGGFGLDHNNFIGRLPQNNAPATSNEWAVFYAERRLQPQTERAVDAHHLPASCAARIERLCARLADLVGPPETPARLHGDLWAGNHVADGEGLPVLIDPAAYAGHREVDLAMMRLFGGYNARVFAAYNEAYPLAPGHERRVPLYQLYYLLVHVNLFGAAYRSGVESSLTSLGF
ncbi:MAG: fructosamine kinase family protein [Deltaproteobacteria bacterium]|nr:fructosamine kinase family protein [Deltaproteobacteria bacterium]